MKITVVFDNNVINNKFIPSHGFSCLIETKQNTVLFDTGSGSSILLSNMRKLDINPKNVDSIVLSHIHEDHIGGLVGFLEQNKGVSVYLLDSFTSNIKVKVSSLGATVEEIERSREIFPGIYTTGELGSQIKEQSLIVDTDKGLVIITGCAHPGVITIIRKAINIIPRKELYLVMGGFHLRAAPNKKTRSIIDNCSKLGLKKIAPCHCSGDESHKQFEHIYAENCIKCGVGGIITL